MLGKVIRSSLPIFAVMIGVTGCSQFNQSRQDGTQSTLGTAIVQSNDTSLNWPVPSFKAIDETGKAFESTMLKGQVWIADVFYSTCPTVCLPIANNMGHLQQQLKKDGLHVQLVSFSVNPQHDTPAVLKEFGTEHGADFSNWHFLTGYSFKWIQQFSLGTFKEPLTQTDSNYYSHTVNWYVIDKSGQITQLFDGLYPPYDKVTQVVKSLE